jgi:hypothetical protein
MKPWFCDGGVWVLGSEPKSSRPGCFSSLLIFLILAVARIEESWDKHGLIGQCGLGCFMMEERLSTVVILDCSFDCARPHGGF